ncbi:uncharacterized protein LOC141657389 [Silene latifolia]|uniref:uncharacterized protein LOC141657389 n=1 Tax=Silene latifolia TaxID=37657 RepID=UPI003D779878
MEQVDPRQQKNKPMFDVIEPSIVRAHFASKKDISFSSYLKPHNNNEIKKFVDCHDKIQSTKAEESDQISIFDAAKYFSGLNDDNQQQQRDQCTKDVDVPPVPPRLSSVSSSVETSSNYGGRNSHSNYRTRSFHATPTASSEASWNSQTGLLANPPGSAGINIIKSFSNNSNGSRGTNGSSSAKWSRISTKWRKCPCLGKKSVQVEERIDSKTVPRMVDLRQGNSNGCSSTLYSPRQTSPKNIGVTLPNLPHDSRTSNFNLLPRNPIEKPGYNSNQSNSGFSSLSGLNSKVVGPLRVYDDLAKVSDEGVDVATNNIISGTTTATATAVVSSNGFTFPILENPPVGVKKMFNVLPPSHHINDEPHRDSLEVFQPRSHPSPNKSRRTSYEDENMSDGSSDLFEIDSFSTSTYPYRDSMDEIIVHSSNFGTSMKKLGIICPGYGNNNNNNNNNRNSNGNEYIDEEPMTPSVAPTDCYAPSEVSIDWSVTTAEGFDRGSVSNFSASASEFAYVAMRREAEQYKNGGGDGGDGREGWHHNNNNNNNSNKVGGKNSSGGLLLGCRNEKAISVGPSPIKCPIQDGPPSTARHVSGGPPIVRATNINGNGNSSKGSLVVGRSRSMPFAT